MQFPDIILQQQLFKKYTSTVTRRSTGDELGVIEELPKEKLFQSRTKDGTIAHFSTQAAAMLFLIRYKPKRKRKEIINKNQKTLILQ